MAPCRVAYDVLSAPRKGKKKAKYDVVVPAPEHTIYLYTFSASLSCTGYHCCCCVTMLQCSITFADIATAITVDVRLQHDSSVELYALHSAAAAAVLLPPLQDSSLLHCSSMLIRSAHRRIAQCSRCYYTALQYCALTQPAAAASGLRASFRLCLSSICCCCCFPLYAISGVA